MGIQAISFVPLSEEYVQQTKALLEQGLANHFGEYDESFNPDITCLFESYERRMIIGLIDQMVVACGAWKQHSSDAVEFVRFSVLANSQRMAIGSRLLTVVENHIQELGFRRVILETTSDWKGVIQFYLANGFRITHMDGGDTYFAKDFSR